MISSAILLAGVFAVGCYFLYIKLPGFLRRLVMSATWVVDILASIGAFILLGGTLTALTAASFFGCIVSVFLYFAKVNQKREELSL